MRTNFEEKLSSDARKRAAASLFVKKMSIFPMNSRAQLPITELPTLHYADFEQFN